MVSRIGGTPSVPPGESAEPVLNRLSKALKSNLGIFNDEMREILKNPHLADNSQALERFAQTVDNLNNLSQQAVNINVK